MARYVFSSHDGFGVGNVRRNVLIARAVLAADLAAEIIVVTGLTVRPAWLGDERIRVARVPGLVKDADDTHQSPEKSWALPAEEYPRVIRSVHTDVRAAVEAGGGRVVDSRCDGSTFMIRYEAAVRGRPANGTIRGWVGPEDVNSHQPPLTGPYYSVIAAWQQSCHSSETTQDQSAP